jgi:eukaryotic-like serine/threonine-protein kinase
VGMGMESKQLYEFGPFRIDPEERVLRRGPQLVPLPPKAFEILLVLVQHAERVTLKDDLMKAVWPDTFVEEANLSQNIFLLRKALGEKAQGSRYIVTVPGRGYRFAVRVNEIIEGAGESITAGPPQPPIVVEQTGPRRNLGWAGLATLLILGAGIVYRFHSRRTPSVRATTAAPGSVRARRSVAVLGFNNLSGNPAEAWLSTALSEMLSTELAAGEQLRMVAAEDVARARMELPLGNVDTLSKNTLTKVRKNLGSDVVVLGSYTVMGQKSKARLRLDLRLQDAVAGETVAEVAATGTEGDLFDLVAEAGAKLRQKLGVQALTTSEALSVRASLPSNPEAARFYSQGLARLRVFDALTARDLLEEAVAAEPSYPLSHAALASAWSSLGYDSRAKREAERAFNLSSKLSREERLLVEGTYREETSDWPKAVANYRALFALFPDNLDYGLRLLHAQVGAANGREAQATLDTLRKLPSPASEDPRIDLAEVDLAYLLSDFKRMLATASRAATRGEALGARLLAARARQAQGEALYYLGQNTQSLASFAVAREVYTAVGDRAHTCGVLRDVADTLSLQGDYSGALELYRESLVIARQVGSKSQMANDLNNMAVLFQSRHDFVTAQKMYEQALAIYREIDDKKRGTFVLCNVGEALFYRGDLAGAESRYRQALSSAREIGDTDGEANQLNDLAILLQTRGDLSGARTTFEQALSLWHDNNVPGSAAAMHGLGEVQLAQGDLARARKTQEEALALSQKLGEKVSIAESRLALAALALEDGRPGDAETASHQAAGEFQEERIPDLEALAYALLARSQIEQGKPEEAQRVIERATLLSANSQEPIVRLSVAITAARVRATGVGGSPRQKASAEAIRDLQGVLQATRKFRFLGLELEARLAIAEIQSDSGSGAMPTKQLASLEEDARARGYGLIARKAAAARGSSSSGTEAQLHK